MTQLSLDSLLSELVDGRTELVFELVAGGMPAHAVDAHKVSLVQWCTYYGDVSAIKFLLRSGATLESLGENLDLHGAAFHGHWRLCRFLLEQGARVNYADPVTGETPLHAALCTTDRVAHDRVIRVLLSAGADPNLAAKNGAETAGFMRDCRTKGEFPLHRAAAFGNEETIGLLLQAGAVVNAVDARGETALSWASWYLRPNSILRLVCYKDFYIRPENQPMRANLLGNPRGSAG